MSMATTAPSRRETQTSSVKPRILIVEDETALVELLRYNLEQAGFSVAVASTARKRWPRSRKTRRTSSCSTGCCP